MTDNIEDPTDQQPIIEEKTKEIKRRGRPKGLRKGEDGKWYKADGSVAISTSKPKSSSSSSKKKSIKKVKHIINYDSDDGPSHEDLIALEEELSQEDKENLVKFKNEHDKSNIVITNWLDEPSHIGMRQIVINPEQGIDTIKLFDKPLVSTNYVTTRLQQFISLFDSDSNNSLLLGSLETFLEDSCFGIDRYGIELSLSTLFSHLQNIEPYKLYYLYVASDSTNYSTPIGIVFRERPYGTINVYRENRKTAKREGLKTLESKSGFYVIYPACNSNTLRDPYSNLSMINLSLQAFVTLDDINLIGIGVDDTYDLYWGWKELIKSSSNNKQTSNLSYDDLVESSKQAYGVKEDPSSTVIDDDEEEDLLDDSYEDDRSYKRYSSYLDMDMGDYYDTLIEKPNRKGLHRTLTDDDIYYPGTDKDKRDYQNLSDGGFRKTNHGLSDYSEFDQD